MAERGRGDRRRRNCCRTRPSSFRRPCSLAAVRTPVWNLVVSNVPGPQFPLYLAGARLEANYPVSVITDGIWLNITVMSYCGHLDFGIVADRDQMRDVWNLIGWLQESLDELGRRTGRPMLPPRTGPPISLRRTEPWRRSGRCRIALPDDPEHASHERVDPAEERVGPGR